MWLIEFTEGRLNGLTLPIESILILTGESNTNDAKTVCLPEYLHARARIELRSTDSGIILNEGKKKRIKIRENFIYSICGLSFFAFNNGNRSPKKYSYIIKRYGILVLCAFFSALLILFFLLFFHSRYQESNTYEYLSKLGNGYIFNGSIYLFNNDAKNKLPKHLQKRSEVLNNDSYQQIGHLNIDIISNNSGKRLDYQVVEKETYSQIRIDFPEKEMAIMQLFGKNGITFYLDNGLWIVDDIIKARDLLKVTDYSSELKKLKSTLGDDLVIDKSEFPYSIFFSTQGGKYIYDQSVRYWEGSNVPNLGVIESISTDKITFIKENIRLVYFVNK